MWRLHACGTCLGDIFHGNGSIDQATLDLIAQHNVQWVGELQACTTQGW
jgi:hypothetical protein